jgi:transposase
MADRRLLELTPEQKQELEFLRDHNPTPYLRERAAALLKVAEGQSPHAVALHGLFRARDPDTIYSWLNRYLQDGIRGLIMYPGRGRKRRAPSPEEKPDRATP